MLLDAHAILHRAYHALPDFTSPKGEPTGALYGVVAMLLKIIEELKPDYIAACFDLPKPTYRHEVYDGYKAGRPKTDDLLIAQIERSRDVFAACNIPVFENPGFEADDILGSIVEQVKSNKQLRTIIASGDMDTLQLVDGKRVMVYTLKKGINDTILYDEDAVKARFGFGPEHVPDYKGLRGDPSDNIPGIKGIGEKGATELIVKFGNIESLYKKLKNNERAVRGAGMRERTIELLRQGEEEAQFSKMLATIRRDAPIHFSLPATTWREGLDADKALMLFNELGFRTLSSRFQNLFGGTAIEEETPHASVNLREFKEAALALWLLNSDTTNPTLDDVLAYGRVSSGAMSFRDASDMLVRDVKAQKLERLYCEVELPLISVLERMEKSGIKIDTQYLAALSKKFHKELAAREEAIYVLAGTKFNINSPKQLGNVLYDTMGLKPKNQKRTATGQRSTREAELEKLKDQSPIIDEILRYRELQKLTSTYVDTIPGMVGADGRLHTTFLQAGTTTGRMSSENPNIQNIPVRTEEGRAIRRSFVAEEGFTLVSIDYSQIELRIAAILSGDERLREIFINGEDVHRGVAARVFGVPETEVTADMRRRAKVINFGILYGMGVNALRANLGESTSREEAQEFLNAYFNTFTRLAEYLEETKREARTKGYTETLFGRRRYFPGMNSGAPMIRAQAERMAINAPVQGTAADLIRIAMVHIDSFIQEQGWENDVRMLLQVHDELVFEVRNNKTAHVVPHLIHLMESVLDVEATSGVPILVEAKTGKNWEEMGLFER